MDLAAISLENPLPQNALDRIPQIRSGPLDDGAIRHVAEMFEATFLAQMLQHSGLAKPRESFGGGAGEAAFSSMLIQAYADKLAEQGGLGLADQIQAQLAERAKG